MWNLTSLHRASAIIPCPQCPWHEGVVTPITFITYAQNSWYIYDYWGSDWWDLYRSRNQGHNTPFWIKQQSCMCTATPFSVYGTHKDSQVLYSAVSPTDSEWGGRAHKWPLIHSDRGFGTPVLVNSEGPTGQTPRDHTFITYAVETNPHSLEPTSSYKPTTRVKTY